MLILAQNTVNQGEPFLELLKIRDSVGPFLICAMFKPLRTYLRRHKWLRLSLILALSWFLAHLIYITIDGLSNDPETADVAIVLGNAANADGSLAPWTQGRVDKALQLYQAGRVKKIFVSGGITHDTRYPEGTAMKAYLLNKGVPDSAVVADNKGINTYYTAINFLEWNKTSHYKSAVIVSQFYHITRSKFILSKMGFDGKILDASSEVYNWQDVFGTLREVPAFYKYLLVY